MKKIEQHPLKLNDILNDYKFNNSTDDDFMYRLKQIIFDLPQIDRNIIIIYAEERSQRKLAKRLNVSLTTVYNKIKEIREYIITKLSNEQ